MLKTFVFLGIIIGGFIFGAAADFLGADVITSIIVSSFGSLVGIGVGYKLSQIMG